MDNTPEDFRTVVREAVADATSFLRLTASGKQKDATLSWLKIVMRPVLKKGRKHLQFSYFDGTKDITKNYAGEEAWQRLDEALAMPFRQFHVQASTCDIHIRISKTGAVHLSRGKPSLAEPPALAHNRVKRYPLPIDRPDDFLRTIGIMDAFGNVKPTMQAKFRQINEFLNQLHPLLHTEGAGDGPMEIVDCGCGSAHLTFAAYHYLHDTEGLHPHITGIDLKEDVIEKCNRLRDALGWTGLEFRVVAIADFAPARPPGMVLSLHACDTATDEAIAQGIRWESRAIVAAPCCQHELRPQVAAPVLQPILRHGLLKQRAAEIVTDAIRSQVLRIMGYRTDVVEFVYPAHTPKNLMIRAEKTLAPGDPDIVREYQELKRFWHVEPCLERLVGDTLLGFLEKNRFY